MSKYWGNVVRRRGQVCLHVWEMWLEENRGFYMFEECGKKTGVSTCLGNVVGKQEGSICGKRQFFFALALLFFFNVH